MYYILLKLSKTEFKLTVLPTQCVDLPPTATHVIWRGIPSCIGPNTDWFIILWELSNKTSFLVGTEKNRIKLNNNIKYFQVLINYKGWKYFIQMILFKLFYSNNLFKQNMNSTLWFYWCYQRSLFSIKTKKFSVQFSFAIIRIDALAWY